MKFKFFSYCALAGVLSLLLTSCIKDDVTEVTTQGDTFLKIVEAPERNIFFEPFTNVRAVDLFSIRKDANSEVSLRTASAIKLRTDTSMIGAYNRENGTAFEVLPDSLYTLGQGITRNGNEYTLPFNSGEFAKEFSINLNGAKWNLEHKYALGFVVADSAGLNLKEGSKEVLVLISVKNKYDGRYEVTGTLTDLVNPALTGVGVFPLVWDLVTSGPNTVVVYDVEYTGSPTHIIETGAGLSQYGAFGLVLEFDPATDKVVRVTNFYGQPASNTRSALLDPSGVNAWDPATGDIQLKYFMLQPSAVPAPPHIRVRFDEYFKYLGPRP